MTKAVFSKVMWVGRATVFLVGLAVILAVVLGLAATALAAVPGDPFRLGQVNTINVLTALVGTRDGGALLHVDNNSAEPGSRALDLRVEQDRAPMTVNATAGKATNLNADKVDGREASELSDPRGYAHIRPTGTPLVDPAYPSKGVNGVVKPVIPDNNLYCFDLDFTPHAAVASPFINNSAVVAIVTPPNTTLTNSCPEPNQDAAVRTYGSNTGTASPDVNFQIVFI